MVTQMSPQKGREPEIVNKVNTANSLNMYLTPFLLSESLKDIKPLNLYNNVLLSYIQV